MKTQKKKIILGSDISNFENDILNVQEEIKKNPLEEDMYRSLIGKIDSLREIEKAVLLNLIDMGDLSEKECIGYINFIKIRFFEDIVLEIIYKNKINVTRECLRKLIQVGLILINNEEKTILIPEIVFINKKMLV